MCTRRCTSGAPAYSPAVGRDIAVDRSAVRVHTFLVEVSQQSATAWVYVGMMAGWPRMQQALALRATRCDEGVTSPAPNRSV